ncbi:MAG TPA: inositol monophosphatase family protein [Verrucomicrobiae bacterium]|nr:inositol monophosphatase family protein [Verrucomicrobiae bacterium]
MNNTSVFPGMLMNEHAAGIVMKELVRRAIFTIRKEMWTFEATEKASLTDQQDFVTTADKAAQQVYTKLLKECFPTFGIVAEEDDLKVACQVPGENTFFTVDPLDGTKAYIRRQSHAIGTMLSLVRNGKVIAAYVGDVMTQEIYGFRPGSDSVRRISEFNDSERLVIPSRSLSEVVVSLRDEPSAFSERMQKLAKGTKYGGIFKHMEVSGGSIGIDAARLWKGEIGALVRMGRPQTPWDYCPMIGISHAMGFQEVVLTEDGFQVLDPLFIEDTQERKYETILIHKEHVPALIGR